MYSQILLIRPGKNLLVMLWPEEYIPREYHDVQWTDSTPIGDVHYTGDVDKGLVRSVTWYKDKWRISCSSKCL